jgi:hypothetical protein
MLFIDTLLGLWDFTEVELLLLLLGFSNLI